MLFMVIPWQKIKLSRAQNTPPQNGHQNNLFNYGKIWETILNIKKKYSDQIQ
jgi:hypothetical protein